jgi:hypothetical protein
MVNDALSPVVEAEWKPANSTGFTRFACASAHGEWPESTRQKCVLAVDGGPLTAKKHMATHESALEWGLHQCHHSPSHIPPPPSARTRSIYIGHHKTDRRSLTPQSLEVVDPARNRTDLHSQMSNHTWMRTPLISRSVLPHGISPSLERATARKTTRPGRGGLAGGGGEAQTPPLPRFRRTRHHYQKMKISRTIKF